MGDFYVTTFCNFAHRMKDGKPINHECFILPPAALRAEREGDYDTANALIAKMRRVLHRGIKERNSP